MDSSMRSRSSRNPKSISSAMARLPPRAPRSRASASCDVPRRWRVDRVDDRLQPRTTCRRSFLAPRSLASASAMSASVSCRFRETGETRRQCLARCNWSRVSDSSSARAASSWSSVTVCVRGPSRKQCSLQRGSSSTASAMPSSRALRHLQRLAPPFLQAFARAMR